MKTESITRGAAALWVVFCTTCYAQPQGGIGQPPPKLTQVTENLYVIENANASIGELITNGGNATVYLTDEGVVLFDTKSAQMHDLVVQQVSSLTDQPVALVVLTHNHADHSAGVAQLQADGATTIISAADRENMNRQPNAGSPQVAYTGSLLLTMGGKEVHLREIRGHTQGDTIAWLAEERVLVAGDLVTTADSIPVIVNYEDGGSWIALETALDEIAEYDFEFLISGHGPVISKGEFLRFRQKVTDMIARVRTLARQDASREAVAEALLAEFNWGGGLATGNIPNMMQELK
jgi:glyoxylase-like metal-dependent hydrolase (beta-lactamase superfamily II)